MVETVGGALGGSRGENMPARLNKMFRKPCLHEHTIVVRSSHVERKVCESCGYLSFTMIAGASPDRAERRNRVLQPG